MIPSALTIAGSDPSGGAGIQADLKIFHQRKVYGMSVITLLTVQNTLGVQKVYILKPFQVTEQLKAVLTDIRPSIVKTGALGNRQVILAVAQMLKKYKFRLIIDPVMISKHGAPLLRKDAVKVLKEKLIPYAVLVTPNLQEAEILSGIPVYDLASMKAAAKRIHGLGVRSVLIKGGHLRGVAADLVYHQGRFTILRAKKIRTRNTHGTGCTYSAVITAELAKGKNLLPAVRIAKKFMTRAIQTAPGLGQGIGPVNHFVSV